MKNNSEPIIIHKVGLSGKVKETYFGLMRNNKPEVIPNVDTFEELLIKLKSNMY